MALSGAGDGGRKSKRPACGRLGVCLTGVCLRESHKLSRNQTHASASGEESAHAERGVVTVGTLPQGASETFGSPSKPARHKAVPVAAQSPQQTAPWRSASRTTEVHRYGAARRIEHSTKSSATAATATTAAGAAPQARPAHALAPVMRARRHRGSRGRCHGAEAATTHQGCHCTRCHRGSPQNSLGAAGAGGVAGRAGRAAARRGGRSHGAPQQWRRGRGARGSLRAVTARQVRVGPEGAVHAGRRERGWRTRDAALSAAAAVARRGWRPSAATCTAERQQARGGGVVRDGTAEECGPCDQHGQEPQPQPRHAARHGGGGPCRRPSSSAQLPQRARRARARRAAQASVR